MGRKRKCRKEKGCRGRVWTGFVDVLGLLYGSIVLIRLMWIAGNLDYSKKQQCDSRYKLVSDAVKERKDA